MNERDEVFKIIDGRIDQLNRETEYFIKFGNRYNQKDLVKQIARCAQLEELITIRNSLKYTVGWRNDT